MGQAQKHLYEKSNRTAQQPQPPFDFNPLKNHFLFTPWRKASK